MGVLALKRLMSTQSERRRYQIGDRPRDRCSSSVAKRNKDVASDDISPGAKRPRLAPPDLPEDIWRHIHSLMSLRDAARTAWVSRSFEQSWICHPNLTFDKSILGSKNNGCGMDFIRTINRVLEKHEGINVKTLTIELDDFSKFWHRQLYNVLQIAMIPGIEEITLKFGSKADATFNFPCGLLSDGIRNSIRRLELRSCVFRPTVKLDPFRNLAILHFRGVCITGHELECLLSNTLALEWLELCCCDELDSLKIPCQLQRLNYLRVHDCPRLYVIEMKAPNLRVFNLETHNVIKLSFGVSVKLKQLSIISRYLASYSRLKFLSNVPDLEHLNLKSRLEMANQVARPRMLPGKFLHLKDFRLSLTGLGAPQDYNYLMVASLLDSCPSLRSIFLNVSHTCKWHQTIFEDPTHLGQMQGQQHGNLKRVTIVGFCSAKSLVDLACYIIDNTASFESLTLDIHGTRGVTLSGMCMPRYEGKFMEAPRTLLAIKTYIQGRIPSTVKLDVLEPCSPCNTVGH